MGTRAAVKSVEETENDPWGERESERLFTNTTALRRAGGL